MYLSDSSSFLVFFYFKENKTIKMIGISKQDNRRLTMINMLHIVIFKVVAQIIRYRHETLKI